MSTERDEELKALGEELGRALFAWYQARGQLGRADAVDTKLYEVVGRTFMPFYPGAQQSEPNKPTGFVTRKPWAQIPAGWFVRPERSTDWWEVVTTRAENHTQRVTLAYGDRSGTWPRNPEDIVSCRRGTAPGTPEISDGLELLGEGAQIISDEVK